MSNDSQAVEEISQASVDETVVEAREYWESVIKESGLTQTEYIASGQATSFLAQYTDFQNYVVSEGFECPNIAEGVTVTITEGEADE